MDEQELLHYGVPGMRWGVRKKTDDVKRKRRDSKADNDGDEEHEDYKKTVARKSMKSMSTKEIQEINTRIQAENQFRELNKTGFDKFKDRVKSVAANIAEEQAKKFVNHYADAGREKVQGFIDEKTGLGTLLGLDTKSEQNRKAFDLKLKTTREQWEKAFGKKKDETKPEQPKPAEEQKEEAKAEVVTPKKVENKTADSQVAENRSEPERKGGLFGGNRRNSKSMRDGDTKLSELVNDNNRDERSKELSKFLNSKGSFEKKGKDDGESNSPDVPKLTKSETSNSTESKPKTAPPPQVKKASKDTTYTFMRNNGRKMVEIAKKKKKK